MATQMTGIGHFVDISLQRDREASETWDSGSSVYSGFSRPRVLASMREHKFIKPNFRDRNSIENLIRRHSERGKNIVLIEVKSGAE
jgi:hypothetical protein